MCSPGNPPGEYFFYKGRILAGEKILVVDKASLVENIEERCDLLTTETEDASGLVETLRRCAPAMTPVLIGDQQSIDAALEMLKSGPQSFVIEPLSLSELVRAIEDALERKRLLRDNKRLKALLPLFEISKTLMSEVELGKLFDVILEIVCKETEADGVSLMLLEAGQELVVKAALGPLEWRNNGKERVGVGIAGWVAKTAEPLMLTAETHIEPPLRRMMAEMGAFSVLCLPLVAKRRVIGVLRSSKSKGTPFSFSDLEFLTILCGQVAIAIENARLLSKVKTQQVRVAQLLKQTTLAQEEERKRISLEIHDGAAQWMVAASHRIHTFERILAKYKVAEAGAELSKIRNVIDQSTKELRRVIVDLHPLALAELGLLGALRQNLESFEKDTGIAYSLQIEGRPLSLPPISEIAVYRGTQEALANVRKHAQATKVDVILRFQEDELYVAIRDNGKGFDLPQVFGNARSAGRVGLLGMKGRMETLGSTLSIETAAGAGTTISFTLPVSAPLPKEISPMAKMLVT